MKYTIGNKPGKGSYKCTTCGEIVFLQKDTDFLRRCPRCHRIEFEKI